MEREHLEYQYRAPTSETVLVFIHGILGSPLQFDFLVEELDRKYSVQNLLLPGHGQTAKTFAKSNFAQWMAYVEERIKVLRAEYKNIILVGHSMGCLLSVRSVSANPESIRGLFLIALPLRIHIRYTCIKNNLAVVLSKNDKNEMITAARKGNSVAASNPLEYLAGVPRYLELLSEARKTRALFKKIELPIVLVQLEKDEIVSVKSLRYAKTKPNIQVVRVDDAGHYFFPLKAQKKISDALKFFLAERDV